jgi:RNA-directed DNA polymerase
MNSILRTAKSASFNEPKEWHQINWMQVNRNVKGIQIRIAKATKEGNWRRVHSLQRFLTRSFCGRAMAVRRVTENKGRRTSGIDKELWSTPKMKWQ